MAAALDAIAERRCTAVVAGGGKSDSPSARFYNRGCLSCYQRNAVPDHGNFDGVADVGTRQSSSMRSQAAILFVADGPSGFRRSPAPAVSITPTGVWRRSLNSRAFLSSSSAANVDSVAVMRFAAEKSDDRAALTRSGGVLFRAF
jgi:hypothetical protein